MFFGSELPLSLYFPVLLLGTRSLEIKALGTALEVVGVVGVVEADVLEDDAIFDLRPEGPSRRAIQSLRYAQGHLFRLPDHIWPWALAQTSIFSKYNTEIKYKLNYSRAMMGIFCFQPIKARIMLAVLNWNKRLK